MFVVEAPLQLEGGFMGRSRYKFYDKESPYFLTLTTVDWLPIFANPDIANIVLESFRYRQKEKKISSMHMFLWRIIFIALRNQTT